MEAITLVHIHTQFEVLIIILRNSQNHREGIAPSPPPLPPRTRTNTNQSSEFHRSYTNPETDAFKKRTYNIFEFLRHKRTGSCNGNPENFATSTPPTSADSAISMTSSTKPQSKAFDNITAASKRSSFSSPDLTKIEPYSSSDADDDDSELLPTEHIDDLNATTGHFDRSAELFASHSPEPMQVGSSAIGSSCSSSQRTSAASLPSAALSDFPPSPLHPSPPSSPLCMNVSESIQPSYNASCGDMSAVNLVGADVADRSDEQVSPKLEQIGVTLIDCTSGYCSMAPIFRPVTVKTPLSPFSGAELARSITARPGEDERLCRAIKQLLITDADDDVVDAPFKVPEVQRDLKKERASPISLQPYTAEQIAAPNEGVYSNIDILPIDPPDISKMPTTTAATTPAPPPKRHKAKSLLLCSKSPTTNSSCEEKYPSYFPNSNIRQPSGASPRRSPLRATTSPNQPVAVVPLVRSHHHHTPRSTTNVFLSTPHSKVTRKSPPSKSAHKSRVAVDLRNINGLRGDAPPNHSLAVPRPTSDSASLLADDCTLTTNSSQTPQRRYTKYATTVRRPSPNRYTGGAPLRACVTETTPSSASVPVAVLQSANSVDPKQPSGSVSNLGSSIKRFASLPRFRKIDFSPLKIRINNVLQRTNSENF